MALTGLVEVKVKGKTYKVQISPPAPMASLEDLEKALQANREQFEDANKAIIAEFKKDVFKQPPPWEQNYESPNVQAIVSHLNINVLVPLIKMKGGKAEFSKPETFPVEQRMAVVYKKAEMQVLNEFHTEQAPFKMAVVAVMLITLMIIMAIM